MFLNFLVRKYCSVCHKIDRCSILENKGSFDELDQDDLISEQPTCSCSQSRGFYYKSTTILRAIQTIVLVVIFVTTISTLIVIRNAPTLNVDFSGVISGYIDSKKGLDDFRAREIQEQLANRSFDEDGISK